VNAGVPVRGQLLGEDDVGRVFYACLHQ